MTKVVRDFLFFCGDEWGEEIMLIQVVGLI